MGTVAVEIDTRDRRLLSDLFETQSFSTGQSRAIPGDATLTLEGLYVRKALDVPETIHLAVTFGSGVASGLIANWLYGKLKGRNVTLRIDRTEVEVDEGQIKRIVQQRIERKG